jgi:hypothetical protein
MKNWEHKVMTEEELKTLVTDVYDAKVFTSLHLDNNSSYLIGSIFMPLIFLSSPPSEPILPKQTGNIRKDRKNKLLQFDEIEAWKTDYKQWEDETPLRDAFIKNVGMIYEIFSAASPTGINGYPIFYSCKIVSKEDTTKFLVMYEKYKNMREEFEKKW